MPINTYLMKPLLKFDPCTNHPVYPFNAFKASKVASMVLSIFLVV